MAQDKRIGIIYNYNENWIGGTYYIQNLIRSLYYLPDKERIKLYILTHNQVLFQELKESTQYPKLKFVPYPSQYNKWEVIVNRVAAKILKKKIIIKKIRLDWVFPLYSVPNSLQHIKDLVFWIPDLQEKYLPNFFSTEDVVNRNHCCENMIALHHPIVFSSQAALVDFETFYPDSKNQKHVISFAVLHPYL